MTDLSCACTGESEDLDAAERLRCTSRATAEDLLCDACRLPPDGLVCHLIVAGPHQTFTGPTFAGLNAQITGIPT